MGFVEVGDRAASSCPKSSMLPTSLLRSRALGTPEFSFRPNRSPGRPLCTWASGFQQRNGFFTTINFWSKSSATPPCKNHKQKVGSSLSHRLFLLAPPQVERGGCMQGNGLEKESWAQLPLLVLSGSPLPGLRRRRIDGSVRLRCKTVRAAGWLSVIRITTYSIVIASRMLFAAL